MINVTDNRVGWGVAGRGHGLAGLVGLADRLRGVDGTLTVSSPGSGTTSLTATLPRLRACADSTKRSAGSPTDSKTLIVNGSGSCLPQTGHVLRQAKTILRSEEPYSPSRVAASSLQTVPSGLL